MATDENENVVEQTDEEVSFDLKQLLVVPIIIILLFMLYSLIIKPALVGGNHSPSTFFEETTGSGEWKEITNVD